MVVVSRQVFGRRRSSLARFPATTSTSSCSLAAPSEPFLEADLLAESLTQQVQALLDLGADSPVAVAAIAVLVDGRRLIAAYAHPGVGVPPAVRVREERHQRTPPRAVTNPPSRRASAPTALHCETSP